mmetsp:Transcript_107520/g.288797  ORF Transcript_107520/g.288797 Transcript_107520/m.288797 type:complete len:210 (-) Transcript_107520:10-639(-)
MKYILHALRVLAVRRAEPARAGGDASGSLDLLYLLVAGVHGRGELLRAVLVVRPVGHGVVAELVALAHEAHQVCLVPADGAAHEEEARAGPSGAQQVCHVGDPGAGLWQAAWRVVYGQRHVPSHAGEPLRVEKAQRRVPQWRRREKPDGVPAERKVHRPLQQELLGTAPGRRQQGRVATSQQRLRGAPIGGRARLLRRQDDRGVHGVLA